MYQLSQPKSSKKCQGLKKKCRAGLTINKKGHPKPGWPFYFKNRKSINAHPQGIRCVCNPKENKVRH